MHGCSNMWVVWREESNFLLIYELMFWYVDDDVKMDLFLFKHFYLVSILCSQQIILVYITFYLPTQSTFYSYFLLLTFYDIQVMDRKIDGVGIKEHIHQCTQDN
jgi:hypothetical protein